MDVKIVGAIAGRDRSGKAFDDIVGATAGRDRSGKAFDAIVGAKSQ